MSGKLPVVQPALTASDAEAVQRLGEAAQEAFRQASDAMQQLAIHFAKISAIGARLGDDIKAQIGEISDGTGDDSAPTG